MHVLLLVLGLQQLIQAQQTDSAVYYFQKAQEAQQQRRFKVAEQCISKSFSFEKKDVELYLAWGNILLDLRNYALAYEKFKLAEGVDPSNPLVIRSLAELSFNLHQYGPAIQYAQQMMDRKIGKGAALMLARAYYETSQYAKAIRSCEAAFKDDTTLAEPSYIAARSFMEIQQYKNAALCFEQALAKDTNNVRWMYETAMSWYAVPDDKKSLYWMEKARDKGHPQTYDFLQNLSTAYMNAGFPEKSLEILLGQLSQKSDDPTLIYTIADTYFKAKKYDEAIQYWNRCLQLDPKNAQALYMTGICYIRKGEQVKGQQLCDKALAMDPSIRQRL